MVQQLLALLWDVRDNGCLGAAVVVGVEPMLPRHVLVAVVQRCTQPAVSRDLGLLHHGSLLKAHACIGVVQSTTPRPKVPLGQSGREALEQRRRVLAEPESDVKHRDCAVEVRSVPGPQDRRCRHELDKDVRGVGEHLLNNVRKNEDWSVTEARRNSASQLRHRPPRRVRSAQSLR